MAVILSVILREYSLYPAHARPAEPIARILITPSRMPLIIGRRTARREPQEV
jgi:hypothetical protein